MPSLIQPLFSGPLDIVADIHGEIDALLPLLHHLGYSEDGKHPSGRRLVFLGDLTDRGPDSPSVFSLVSRMVESGLAQCILGNHELNLLQKENKHGNGWFYGKDESLNKTGEIVPQKKLQNDQERAKVLDFFKSLPLALERADLRVVHACWDDAMIAHARHSEDVINLLRHFKKQIGDQGATGLDHQNKNPVKVLTSGPEAKVATPFWAACKERDEGRVRWWDQYAGIFCVFGHYWRRRLPNDQDGDHAFDDSMPYSALGNGSTMCIDYSVGKRWQERLQGTTGPFHTQLAALRWPEKVLVFDDGKEEPIRQVR